MSVLPASLAVLVLVACGGDPPPPGDAPRGPVVAEVNGVRIHREELEARMRHDGLPARAALERLIDEELTLEAARRLGLEPAGDAGDTRKRAEVQALLAREVEAKFGPDDVTPALVAAAWEQGRQLEADHLLVKVDESADAATKARARAFAAEVGAAARRTTDRAAFIGLARTMHREGLELTTEDLGKFVRDGHFVATFEARVFLMTREGEISEPFQTEFGWHVVRLRGVGNTLGESLETARADVIEKIVIQKRRSLFEALMRRLEGDAHVEIDPSTLSRLDAPP